MSSGPNPSYTETEDTRIATMRMPSPGKTFEFNDFKFEIVKSRGGRFKARGNHIDPLKKIKPWKSGDFFHFLGTKFAVQKFAVNGNLATLTAVAAE